MTHDLVFIPVIIFKGKSGEDMEAPSGEQIRERVIYYFYRTEEEAKNALKELLDEFHEHGCSGKILVYKRYGNLVTDAK
jgi:hypothetical protein